MQNIVDELQCNQYRDSTKKNYYGIWKSFNDLFLKLDDKPLNRENRIVLFIGYLADSGKKSTTIKCYVSTIKTVLQTDNIKLNLDELLLSSLTRACKLKNDAIARLLPIHKSMLNTLLRHTESLFGEQPYLQSLYMALFSTAYFGLFHVGELTSSQHVVKAKNVHVGRNKNKMLFVLTSSKTHSICMKPQQIKISSTRQFTDRHGAKTYCPYLCLRNYIDKQRGFRDSDEQFFIFSDGSPVQSYHFRNTLKNVIKISGFDSKYYGTHGLRAGHASDMIRNGVSIEMVRKIGRWRSNAIYTYLRN